MQMLMESCPGKTAVSGVMGFALGGAFGLFMASVSFLFLFSHPLFHPLTYFLSHLPLSFKPHLTPSRCNTTRPCTPAPRPPKYPLFPCANNSDAVSKTWGRAPIPQRRTSARWERFLLARNAAL